MPFALQTDARPVKAARELKAILTGYGINRTLRTCREVVAGMYGYRDWGDMLANLGQGMSPDDAEADEAERIERRETQVRALRRTGLDGEALESVRERLSVTGRGEADAAEVPIARVQRTIGYHPYRMLDDVEGLQRLRQDMQGRGLGWEGYRSDGMGTLTRIVEDFATAKGAVPLDLLGIDTEAYDNLAGAAYEVMSETMQIVDASVAVATGNLSGVADTPPAGMPDDFSTHYVHLGENAFPSPFPGCGIEGCYLSVDASRLETTLVKAVFVVSPELPPGVDHHNVDLDRPAWQSLMYDARHVACIGDIPSGAPLTAVVENPEFFEDGTFDTWSPYLTSPLLATWHALRAERAGAGVTDGIPVDLSPTLPRRLARARTPGQRDRVLAEIARDGEALIRFVGGVPLSATDPGETKSGPAAFPDPQVDEPLDWAHAYCCNALEAEAPSAKVMFSDRAIRYLGDVDATPPSSRARGILSRALSTRSDGLVRQGHLDEAAACLSDAIARGAGVDLSRLHFRLAAIHVMRGDRKAATEAADRIEDDHFADVDADWAYALVDARFSTGKKARRTVALAGREYPGVLPRLMDQWPLDAFRWLPAAGNDEHDLLLTGLQHDAWRTIEGYETILSDGRELSLTLAEDDQETSGEWTRAWGDILDGHIDRNAAYKDRQTFLDDLMYRPDTAGSDGSEALWKGSGAISESRWEAQAHGHGATLFLRVKLDGPMPAVGIYEVYASPPGMRINEGRFHHSINMDSRTMEVDGDLSLTIKNLDFYTNFDPLNDAEWLPQSGNGFRPVEAAGLSLIRERLPALIDHLAFDHRTDMARIVGKWKEARDLADRRRSEMDEVDSSISGLIARMPERDRRKLEGQADAEIAVVPSHFRESSLGVLRTMASHDGEHVLFEPTARKPGTRPRGELHDDGKNYTAVNRDGTVKNARFSGCSQSLGEGFLREAAKSYVTSYPHAFDRARLAKEAERRLEAVKHLDKAEGDERTQDGILSRAKRRHDAVVAFLGDMGRKVDFPDILLPEEPPQDDTPTGPLW